MKKQRSKESMIDELRSTNKYVAVNYMLKIGFIAIVEILCDIREILTKEASDEAKNKN